MGKYKIPRSIGVGQKYAGMDWLGWVGAAPFIIAGVILAYIAFGMDKGKMAYVVFGIGVFIGFVGYGLFKPLPQLTERPIVYLYRRYQHRNTQKKYTWGRKQ